MRVKAGLSAGGSPVCSAYLPSSSKSRLVCLTAQRSAFVGDAMDASLPTGTDTRLLNADGMSRRLSGRETSSHRGGSSDGYGIKVPMA